MYFILKLIAALGGLWFATLTISPAVAQIAPTSNEIERMSDLHKSAHIGDVKSIANLIAQGVDVEKTDARQRTAAHIAAFASKEAVLRLLAKAGADLNALEFQKYDIVTIASVANDTEFLEVALELGASAKNMTSLYDGTALIAAAHLGHHEVVKILIDAGAPLNHVNNLHWTALIESVVLGDGGKNHTESARHLVQAGADKSLADRNGITPLEHAKARGYNEMIQVLSE